MASSNWKKVELKKCRELGGERSGPTGRDDPDCKDIPLIGLEIKAYKRLVFLTEDWNQAVRNAAKHEPRLIPALNVREGGRGGRDVVQMRHTDFAYLRARVCHCLTTPYEIAGTEKTTANLLVRIQWPDFTRLFLAATTEGELS